MENTYQIGDTYTTTKTGQTGTIQEIVTVRPDLVKVRILVEGVNRWTTWKAQ